MRTNSAGVSSKPKNRFLMARSRSSRPAKVCRRISLSVSLMRACWTVLLVFCSAIYSLLCVLWCRRRPDADLAAKPQVGQTIGAGAVGTVSLKPTSTSLGVVIPTFTFAGKAGCGIGLPFSLARICGIDRSPYFLAYFLGFLILYFSSIEPVSILLC